MIHVVRWHASTGKAEQVSVEDLPRTHAELPPDEVVWLDLTDPTPAEEARVLGEFLPVHALTFADATKLRRDPEQGSHLPKVEEFPDYLFVVVNPLPQEAEPGNGRVPSPSKLHRPQLSAVLTHRVLVTHHYSGMPCIADGQAHLSRHAENLRRGPDYIFHLILDGIVDEYAPVVDVIGERLDELELQMFRRPTPEVLAELLRVKREVSYLRKTLIMEREVLARLIRGEFKLVETREIVYYRNVFDHLVRYTELIESSREMVSDLMQTHLSASSQKLNEVMKTLTMISTIGLVCGLIAGIYGMNFENLPEKSWEYGYPFALGLMAVAAVSSFLFFKWKKWV